MKFVRLPLFICCFFMATGVAQARPLSVVFINPGNVQDVGIWDLVTELMQAAANDLAIELEVIHAKRNHIKMLEQVTALSERADPPDYIIVVNIKHTGDNMLLRLKNSPSKILLMHNDLTAEQRLEIGGERDFIPNWIGTVTTDEYQAGYLQIEQLYRHAPANPKVVAISGTLVSPASDTREQGLRDYISDLEAGSIYQVVNGEWSYDDGKHKAVGLLNRYGDVDIIWASNDSMALGACDAVRELNKEHEVIVGGLGGFPHALASIKQGHMKLTVAGHSMIGAWALVLLHDHYHGYDFVDDVGLNIKADHLTVIDSPEKADQYIDVVLTDPGKIDFKRFSKKFNDRLLSYDFSYPHVVIASQQGSGAQKAEGHVSASTSTSTSTSTCYGDACGL